MAKRVRIHQPDFPPLGLHPRASIIIVTYNLRGKYLAECLAALRNLDYLDYEVIAVDNHSDDDTPSLLQKLCTIEKVILNQENRGFGGGCNDGAREASGQILVFLNADTVVHPNWLKELVTPFTCDTRTAITGCKMYFPGGQILQHAGGILHGNGMTEHRGYCTEDNGSFDDAQDVDYVTGAGMAVRREYFDLCGGFDEDYFPAYCEELDICYRAHLMDYRVIYCPKAILVHHESPLVKNQSPLFQRLMFRGRILFCIKNYRWSDWIVRFLPCEIRWLRMPASKGYRKKQIRAYADGIRYLMGQRLSPQSPLLQSLKTQGNSQSPF